MLNFTFVFGFWGCSGNEEPKKTSRTSVVGKEENTKSSENNATTKKEEIIAGDGYSAILIPNGSFEMGCNSEQGKDCRYDTDAVPVHNVTISNDFYMMKTEVTNHLYAKVVGKKIPVNRSERQPVENVSWFDAVHFANVLSENEGLEQCYQIDDIGEDGSFEKAKVTWGKKLDCRGWRLPTEAEWEYAARGGEKYKYSGSDDVEDVAWTKENSDKKPHFVGQKNPNGFGLHDMSGNVWEWVWDLWKDDYYKNSPATDPLGPTPDGSWIPLFRGIRGGKWNTEAWTARISRRAGGSPWLRGAEHGFRLVRTKK